MTNFVYDNTALPAAKSDKNPVTDPTHQWAAADATAVFQALTDIRKILQGTTVNVTAFGAVGDGTTDDQPAIQAAIDFAATLSGGVYGSYVQLPKGVFAIGAPIIGKNGIGILGAGPSATILRAKSTFNSASMVRNQNQDGTQEYFFIQGLEIDGNAGAGAICSTAAVDIGCPFINSYIRDCVILGSSSVGLHVWAGNSPGGMGPFLIDNVWVLSSGSHNVLIEELIGNTGGALGIVAVNLTSEHQGQNSSAIYLKGHGSARQWNFYNTHIEQGFGVTGRTGITVDGVSNVKFDGVQLGAVTAVTEGIKITSDSHNTTLVFENVINPNSINPVLRDLKNSVTIGAIDVPKYVTPDFQVRGGMRFTPDVTTGARGVAFTDSNGTDRAWFDDKGALNGAGNLTGSLEIIGDATNDRVAFVNHAKSRVFTWGFPDGSTYRLRSVTTGIDCLDVDNSGNARLLQGVTLNVSGGTTKIAGNIGFYNTAPAAKPTITGSRGGNAALASLLTGLAGLGLITDSTTA